MEKIKKKCSLMSLVIFLLSIAVTIICIGIERHHISPPESLQILVSPLTGQEVGPQGWSAVYHVRLFRIMLALVAGMGLSILGVSFQALFSSPLATPDTLGVATGVSFGVVLAFSFTRNVFMVQLAALATGLAALVGACMISRFNGKSSILMVVLGRVAVSSLSQALVSPVKYVAGPDEDPPAITYQLMRSMSRATYQGLAVEIPLILLGAASLSLLRWRLNILSLQEDETRALGTNVRKLWIMVMVASTLVVASCVSLCGQVGWVGLLVLRVARMFYGSDDRKIIPVSMGLGSAFMVVIDTASRTATAVEIPVSILMAIIGALFFIIPLCRIGGARL